MNSSRERNLLIEIQALLESRANDNQMLLFHRSLLGKTGMYGFYYDSATYRKVLNIYPEANRHKHEN